MEKLVKLYNSKIGWVIHASSPEGYYAALGDQIDSPLAQGTFMELFEAVEFLWSEAKARFPQAKCFKER